MYVVLYFTSIKETVNGFFGGSGALYKVSPNLPKQHQWHMNIYCYQTSCIEHGNDMMPRFSICSSDKIMNSYLQYKTTLIVLFYFCFENQWLVVGYNCKWPVNECFCLSAGLSAEQTFFLWKVFYIIMIVLIFSSSDKLCSHYVVSFLSACRIHLGKKKGFSVMYRKLCKFLE